eukprot:360531-Chlamydomonas_euryale.AAC.3
MQLAQARMRALHGGRHHMQARVHVSGCTLVMHAKSSNSVGSHTFGCMARCLLPVALNVSSCALTCTDKLAPRSQLPCLNATPAGTHVRQMHRSTRSACWSCRHLSCGAHCLKTWFAAALCTGTWGRHPTGQVLVGGWTSGVAGVAGVADAVELATAWCY